jgi:hypothetical protein
MDKRNICPVRKTRQHAANYAIIAPYSDVPAPERMIQVNGAFQRSMGCAGNAGIIVADGLLATPPKQLCCIPL